MIERARKGSLHSLQVSKRQRVRYCDAVHYFLENQGLLFTGSWHSLAELDWRLTIFIEHMWAIGEPRWRAADVICGIQFW